MVCFLHPDDFGQQAKKGADMPEKFQKIYKNWAVFNQPLSRFKNDIRENRKRTYNLSIWLGSERKTDTIINGCTLDWDNEQKCGGFMKIAYKRIQSLNTGKNLILVGVPMDMCADSLQQVLREKMEEAREKMVTKNPYKYGIIDRVPHFVLERNFVKNTPYPECSEEDNIPFWLRTPYHLEYVFVIEEHLELILHYMYWLKRFQFLFREVAFYYKNPGMEASGSEQGTLAGVLMRRIAMVRSMNKVILKGIAHVDRRFLLARYVDKTETAEIDLEVDRSVQELMMEKRVACTKVWILIAQLQDGRWAGFYRSRLGNDPLQEGLHRVVRRAVLTHPIPPTTPRVQSR
jgi:hypothetical protein